MRVTFWGVRGSIPAPGPGTVRYGGNTACISVETKGGELFVLDLGTGARSLGLSLVNGAFGRGRGRAAILLSHAHWDHIQGFPFFGPLYVPGNTFSVFGSAESPALLEGILEGQMAPHYFPVQTLRNMGASISCETVREGRTFDVNGCRVTAALNPHGRTVALAFRIEEGAKALVYAPDAGYGPEGPSLVARRLYADVDLLIHDSTFTAADQERHPGRGHSSVEDAVAVALTARAKAVALFHYDQDYSDADVDAMAAHARTLVPHQGTVVHAAHEGLTLEL
jgi:phosphoribosyl 1,2-cyclic phosphodiesterase